MNNNRIADISPFDLTKIDGCSSSQVLGYNLTSTANIYVEDAHIQLNTDLLSQNIDKIAEHLLKSDNPQLIVSIHGYANSKKDAQGRYAKIYDYASKICKSKTVFVGYRWPAENPLKDDIGIGQKKPNLLTDKIKFAFEALPTLLLGGLITNVVLGVVTIAMLLGKPIIAINIPITFAVVAITSIVLGSLLNKLGNASKFIPPIPNGLVLVSLAVLIVAIATLIPNPVVSNFLLVMLAVVFMLGCGVVFALMALRLSTYPSDRYRANNYGVVDMVEFIRQLDKAIFIKACEQLPAQERVNIRSIDDEKLNKCRVKISFINHSLGCEIVTQTVRILSDVFDPDAAKKPTNNLVPKKPSPDIGRVFSLSRLILVAPDIPVESILSGRANFLRSSLRRCEEAYIFSNEGDLALRLASTAANYFSFPTTTRFRGYKLGNITAKHYENRNQQGDSKLAKKDYGIVNNYNSVDDNKPYKHLEIRASNLEHLTLKELAVLKQTPEKQDEIERVLEENAVADCFTYFDCTDYVDVKAAPGDSNIEGQKGLLSFALRKSALNFWGDYISLAFAYFFTPSNSPRYINVHGGYFEGEFSQRLIYQLAFLGFQGMLNSNFENSLDKLSDYCQEKGIQVVLDSRFKN